MTSPISLSLENYLFLFSRYVRALGAMYMRLVGTSLDCFNYLEPLFNDYRKLKKMNKNGGNREQD